MSLLECYTLEPATFSGNAPISSPTQARGRQCSHDRVDDGRGAARHRANCLNSHLAIQVGSDTSLLLYFFTHGEAAASGGRTRPGETCPRRVPAEGTERRRSSARPSRLLALGATIAIFEIGRASCRERG